MSQTQECPHCGFSHRVAGLFQKGPHDKTPYNIYCTSCSSYFEPQQPTQPVYEKGASRAEDN